MPRIVCRIDLRHCVAFARAALTVRQAIELVQHIEHGLFGDAKLLEDFSDSLDLELRSLVRHIDDMQQKIGFNDLFERCVKGLHERMRQLLNETHGIGHEDFAAVRELKRARRRVERRKELVLGENVCARQGVQERRLAGVRIADEGGDGDARSAAALAMQQALLLEPHDLALDVVDTTTDATTVDFELCLAGAACADAAAEP